MREVFVSELVKNLLGPRNGINEILDSRHKPIIEYITGILSPRDDMQEINIKENMNNGNVTSQAITKEDDDTDDMDSQSLLNPTLNPDKISSSMGISFQVSASPSPEFKICITWSRYLVDSKGNWNRHPRYCILGISGTDESIHYVDSSGNECDEKDAEIMFDAKIELLKDGKYFIALFVVNVKQSHGKDNKSQYYIFQPQIRVLCIGNTKLIPMGNLTDSDRHNEFAYRNRKFYARGHMTSAVWRDIDPENIPDELGDRFVHEAQNPPFKWIDGEIVPKEHAEKFSNPDLRTEFIPLYSIPAPEIDWSENDGKKPVLMAEEFANMWDATKLRESLDPIRTQYKSWISSLDDAKDGTNDDLVDEIKKNCEGALARINDGIDTLATNDDVRLAFCFANKAIDIQSHWSRKCGMTYRPFQIAFVLMSLESILNPDSKFRETCDLLWVPTGTGKTEAYLVLVAISMAYKRLQELKKSKSGVGVDVISRYTLRLLTIQQFRRSISLFTAAEKLRVENLAARKSIGWRPDEFPKDDNLIWGSTPFSVGLWVGNSVTPNKLDDTHIRRGGRHTIIPGALDILKKPEQSQENGEPAQILECPACGNTLAIPDMGLAASPVEPHEINWIVNTDLKSSELSAISISGTADLRIKKFDLYDLNQNFKILSIKFTSKVNVRIHDIDQLWYIVEKKIKDAKHDITLESASSSRPGYFYKNYISSRGNLKRYDFQIFCTRQGCPLEQEWLGGSVVGGINCSTPDPNISVRETDGVVLNDGNALMEIRPCFRKDQYISLKIPINGLTVDQQIYRTAPTMIIATVDKFARLPFEPQAGILFGNASSCHLIHGYHRMDDTVLEPVGTPIPFLRDLRLNEIPRSPSFIIQDELHLLEGPLGSMLGVYESCVDFLAGRGKKKIKYIASTATIKQGEDQIRSLFVRNLQIFPPKGTDVDDRFFIREKELHPLDEETSGRLYMGIAAPGKGGLTPIVRIWSRLAQTGYELRNEPEIDRFWTITGYFNAVRELAGAKALYRQDIPERIRDLSTNDSRILPMDMVQELSGRTSSNDLPSILDLLGRKHPQAADGLFTTSMFGTGVDVQRIGVMFVNGQPKTTSSYIQSTGRVGRSKGGLVPVFFRISRPRDLSHYEYFIRNHMQIHRTVESSTVNPFSSGAMNRALGPIIIGMLRNMRNAQTQWSRRSSADSIRNGYTNKEIQAIQDFIENRAQNQPDKRRPSPEAILEKAGGCIDRWKNIAQDVERLEYVEYDSVNNSVVLGDPRHENNAKVVTVFANSPQSLRELEAETVFET